MVDVVVPRVAVVRDAAVLDRAASGIDDDRAPPGDFLRRTEAGKRELLDEGARVVYVEEALGVVFRHCAPKDRPVDSGARDGDPNRDFQPVREWVRALLDMDVGAGDGHRDGVEEIGRAVFLVAVDVDVARADVEDVRNGGGDGAPA